MEQLFPLLPPVQDLKDRIDTDPKFNMFFNQMFTNVSPEIADLMPIQNYKVALRFINFVITVPPIFTIDNVSAGVPINAILTYPMGTVEGYAAFLDNDVNKYVKRILVAWKTFLQSKDSALFLNETPFIGWFCGRALDNSDITFMDELGVPQTQKFFEVFVADPNDKETYGYSSWDDYFTRALIEGVRPIASPDDNKVIVNACESDPYNLQFNVKAILTSSG